MRRIDRQTDRKLSWRRTGIYRVEWCVCLSCYRVVSRFLSHLCYPLSFLIHGILVNCLGVGLVTFSARRPLGTCPTRFRTHDGDDYFINWGSICRFPAFFFSISGFCSRSAACLAQDAVYEYFTWAHTNVCTASGRRRGSCRGRERKERREEDQHVLT